MVGSGESRRASTAVASQHMRQIRRFGWPFSATIRTLACADLWMARRAWLAAHGVSRSALHRVHVSTRIATGASCYRGGALSTTLSKWVSITSRAVDDFVDAPQRLHQKPVAAYDRLLRHDLSVCLRLLTFSTIAGAASSKLVERAVVGSRAPAIRPPRQHLRLHAAPCDGHTGRRRGHPYPRGRCPSRPSGHSLLPPQHELTSCTRPACAMPEGAMPTVTGSAHPLVHLGSTCGQ